MRYALLHDIPGRLRVRCRDLRITQPVANAIGQLLSAQEGIFSATLSHRTGTLLIRYALPRRHVLALLDVLEPEDWDGLETATDGKPPSLVRMSLRAVFSTVFWQFLKWLTLPAPLRCGVTLLQMLPCIGKGLASLARGRLDVAVLDAASLAVMAARRDFGGIRVILWMFSAADALEGWTREPTRYARNTPLTARYWCTMRKS